MSWIDDEEKFDLVTPLPPVSNLTQCNQLRLEMAQERDHRTRTRVSRESWFVANMINIALSTRKDSRRTRATDERICRVKRQSTNSIKAGTT